MILTRKALLAMAIIGAAFTFYRVYWPASSVQDGPASPENQVEAKPTAYLKNQPEQLYRASYYQPLIASYQKALKLKPDNIDLQKKLGLAYCGANDYAKAFPLLLKVSKFDEHDDRVFYQLGVIHLKRQEPEAAAASLQQALALNPKHQQADRLLRTIN